MTVAQIKSKLKSNGMLISEKDLQEIVVLPKDIVVPILEEMLRDSIQNIDFYRHRASFVPPFPLPVLFILADKKAEQALPVLLEFMGMPRKDLDFWLGDVFTEKFWLILYQVANNNFLSLIDMALYRKIPTYNLFPISMALSQVAAHQPSRRGEIISYYYLLFKHYLQLPVSHIDADARDLLSGMVCDLMRIRAHELLFMIRKAFNNNYIDKDTTGELEEVIKELRRGNIIKRPIQSVFEVCKDIQNWTEQEQNGAFFVPQFRLRNR